jgi:hypothetical protein
MLGLLMNWVTAPFRTIRRRYPTGGATIGIYALW